MSGSRLEGRVAIISGGARGQGAAEALLFAAEGARVVIGDVLEEEGRQLAAEIGDSAVFSPLDVTQAESWAQVVATCTTRFGPPSVLVNNAGVLAHQRIEDCEEADFRRVLDVNLIGPFLGTRAVIAPMAAAGGGSIINISSVAAFRGGDGLGAYSTSKWGLRGFTKSAAIELGRYGIRVNSVHPGAIDTPMVAGHDIDPAERAGIFGRQPIPRIGQPEEVARLVLFLATDEASFSTGAEFIADGGSLAGRA